MREFSVDEIKAYAERMQASTALRAAVNALEGLLDHPIFTSEEMGSLKALYEELCEVEKFNAARILVFEQAMEAFKTVRPSVQAISQLLKLLEALKEEVQPTAEPTVPMGMPNIKVETDQIQ